MTAAPDTRAFWDERYAADVYRFGEAPNAFLARQAERLQPGLKALSVADGEGRNGVWLAEQDWLTAGRETGLPVHLFRLPALYGPGRSGLDRLRNGEARMVIKPGQVFNRIHVEDVVAGLFASMDRPNPGRAYNLVDDEPAPAHVVTAWTARRLSLPLPPEVDWTDPSVSEGMRRFYLDSKRLSNARAKAELGWRPIYPTYREGIEALIAAGF